MVDALVDDGGGIARRQTLSIAGDRKRTKSSLNFTDNISRQLSPVIAAEHINATI
jgi:hypothetical protein